MKQAKRAQALSIPPRCHAHRPGPRGIRNLNLTARLADPAYQRNVSCLLSWPKAATDKFLLIPKQKPPAVESTGVLAHQVVVGPQDQDQDLEDL